MNKHRLQLQRACTPFDTLFIDSEAPHHYILTIYSLLSWSLNDAKTSFQISWELELGGTFSKEEWSRVFLLCHKSSILCKAPEMNYKILLRWYRVLCLLHTLFPSEPQYYWRYGTVRGTTSRILWECPLIPTFWIKVINLIKSITGVKVTNDSSRLLLSMIPSPMGFIKKKKLNLFSAYCHQGSESHALEKPSPPPPSLTGSRKYTSCNILRS